MRSATAGEPSSNLAATCHDAPSTTHARDLPVYTHDDLASCFGALERHLREHLDLVIAAHAVVVALERASDVLYVGRMDDPRCYEPGARWFLGIRSSIGTAETLDLAPQLLKVCAQKFVLELVRRAYRGLEIEHLPSPPPGLAPRAGLAYFEIAMAGPCAQGLRDTREVGVYVPDAFPDAVLEIAVLVPT